MIKENVYLIKLIYFSKHKKLLYHSEISEIKIATRVLKLFL